MREIALILPHGQKIEIKETLEVNNDPTGNTVHVGNIYQWAFRTFNFRTAAEVCTIIGKNYINSLIDKM